MTEKIMFKETPKGREKRIWTTDSKCAFWEEADTAYERRVSWKGRLTPGSDFWLTDDMEYDVTERKGSGHFATVLRAIHRPTKQVLAVKRFTHADSLKVRREIKLEAKILDLVRHGVSVSMSEASFLACFDGKNVCCDMWC